MLSVYAMDEALENREKPTQSSPRRISIRSLTYSAGRGREDQRTDEAADLSKRFLKQPLIGIASRGSSHTSTAHHALLLHQPVEL